MQFRSFITLTTFFIFLSTFITGIIRFLDNSHSVAVFHMTFSFSLSLIVYFHLYNNWDKFIAILKNQRKELIMALAVIMLLILVAFSINHFSLGATVI